ncbi:MAG: M23 family metallopeptidase [Proteobacteria bacterium]|nr:M23 family metallopeptidase [Candidatus Enterousia onthequi]
MREKFYLAGVLFCVSHIAVADSLLQPVSFPKTFDDVDFSDRYDVLAQDYEKFADLTPYEQLEIVNTDAGIEEEIAEDEQEIETEPVVETASYTKNTQYCAVKNPDIPSGQKFPIGKPVLESDYTFCSKYGWRTVYGKTDFHYGFDIGCTQKHKGRPVFAIADGVVDLVKPNGTGSSAGNYIRIDHQNGFKTSYMHLKDMFVVRGQRVQAGCQIATIGNTGGAKANKEAFANNPYPTMKESISHLHYRIDYTGTLSSVSGNGRTINIVHKPKHDSIDPAPFLGVSPKIYYKP